MTILEFFFFFLVMSIPLASLYLSTISIRFALLIFLNIVIYYHIINGTILSSVLSTSLGILGGLFQPTLPSQSPLTSVGSLLFIDEFNILYSFIPSFQDHLLATTIILYNNAETDKLQIWPLWGSDNKRKTGICGFTKNQVKHISVQPLNYLND